MSTPIQHPREAISIFKFNKKKGIYIHFYIFYFCVLVGKKRKENKTKQNKKNQRPNRATRSIKQIETRRDLHLVASHFDGQNNTH